MQFYRVQDICNKYGGQARARSTVYMDRAECRVFGLDIPGSRVSWSTQFGHSRTSGCSGEIRSPTQSLHGAPACDSDMPSRTWPAMAGLCCIETPSVMNTR